MATLAIAISGLVICGPMELFLPEAMAALIGGWVWLPLLVLYALIVTLVLLLIRPRLVVYNITSERLRPILKEVINELDDQARWAGDSVSLPTLGVNMAIDAHPGIRNVTLASVGTEQELNGWVKLRMRLASALRENRQPANLQGISFLVLSTVLAIAVVYSLFTGRQEIAQAFRQMMRL